MDGMDGRRRAVIERVRPALDDGRFPIKRIVGDVITVEADVFCDGHDLPACALQYRRFDETWRDAAMRALGNDRFRGQFAAWAPGDYVYRVIAWIDHFNTWRHDLSRRTDAADVELALQAGAALVRAAAVRADGPDRAALEAHASALTSHATLDDLLHHGLDESLASLMERHPDRHLATVSTDYPLTVDRERARFSSWYELFPRSCGGADAPHGSFRDCETRLAYVAAMGFDVLYLPPIHPIGRTKRKGRNNILLAAADDPGSPWAIGAPEGGHKAVNPALGTLEDFQRFVGRARELGLEIALDIAFQCSPDHPYVTEHPEWFRRRPDGSIQYAENPPKKYEDIYPFNFESDAWESLWQELRDVVLFWCDQGVRIFRVDNPHTKPFPFWEWLIAQVRREHPDVLFLAEAFSRPRIMHRLAKIGFSQSYTYFTWRNTKWELEHYLTELTRTDAVEYFRPNFWPNTPDILPEYLQYGGRPAFMARLVLAATLSGNYGVYGPAFELHEGEARTAGGEEYLNSEKYEIRRWDLDRPDSLRDFVTRINRIRRDNPALHDNQWLRFHRIDNEQIIAYSKTTEDQSNTLVVLVNLDPYHTQSGWLELTLDELGVDPHQPYQVHDLVSDTRHLWHGARNYVQIDPLSAPAQILRIRRRIRREQDFEYFL